MLREIVFDGDKYGRKWIEILDVANFGTSRLVCRDECHAIAPLKIKRCYCAKLPYLFIRWAYTSLENTKNE